ncbi:11652_t:CDS:2 [Funneliformis geosporum]|nr:11652_t:CDS:2 [Funneliformis geosporum]
MSKNSKHIDLEMIESDESVTLSIGESGKRIDRTCIKFSSSFMKLLLYNKIISYINTIPHPLYSSLFSPHENVSWLRALEKHNNSDSDDDSDGNSDEIQSMGSKNLAEENFLRCESPKSKEDWDFDQCCSVRCTFA